MEKKTGFKAFDGQMYDDEFGAIDHEQCLREEEVIARLMYKGQPIVIKSVGDYWVLRHRMEEGWKALRKQNWTPGAGGPPSVEERQATNPIEDHVKAARNIGRMHGPVDTSVSNLLADLVELTMETNGTLRLIEKQLRG